MLYLCMLYIFIFFFLYLMVNKVDYKAEKERTVEGDDGTVDVCVADIYHSTFDWPSSSSIASRLEEADGTSEDEMVSRLMEHHRNIAGVQSCYQHILKVINADQPKSDVFSQGRCTTLSPSLHCCTLTVQLVSQRKKCACLVHSVNRKVCVA